MNKLMKPHVFARFQQVTFYTDFEFTLAESHLYINDDFNINPDDRARFISFLRRSGIFKLLVQLLSNSLSLHCLSIDLNVEVWANYNSHFDDWDKSDKERNFKMMRAVNEWAANTFMNSGILNPLWNLFNVKSFEFMFDMMTYNFDDYQPQSRQMKMIQNLQWVIQSNWQVKQASQQQACSENALVEKQRLRTIKNGIDR